MTILPLLNLKAHMFLISTYNTLAYSSFEKLMVPRKRNEMPSRRRGDKGGEGQQKLSGFLKVRLATDKVHNQLLKEQQWCDPVLDNQNYKGISTDRYGHTNSEKDVAPIRELYGPAIVTMRQIGAWGAVALNLWKSI